MVYELYRRMNKMLSEDEKTFTTKFQRAAHFMIEAELRSEFYILTRMGRNRSVWEEQRFCELSNTPACKEKWFMEKLKKVAP